MITAIERTDFIKPTCQSIGRKLYKAITSNNQSKDLFNIYCGLTEIPDGVRSFMKNAFRK